MKYLLPMARNTETGVTLKTQDLTGNRFEFNQRQIAQAAADQFAAKMTARTNQQWQGFLVEYTPSTRRL